jgi:hemoglobin
MPVAETHNPKAPGVACGISEAMIRAVVDSFYARVRRDPELGPIFERAIGDWEPHLAKLCDFWSSVLLMTGRFKGRPVPVHVALSQIETRHFDRWLGMFRETAREQCPPDAADLFINRAERIAQSLMLAIDFHRGTFALRPQAEVAAEQPA